MLKPLLDPQAKIDELPRGVNDVVVPQMLNGLPDPISYSVAGIVKEDSGTRITTTYIYAGGISREQRFFFNTAGRIIDFDVLGDVKKVTTKSACVPDGTTVIRKQ